LLVYSIHLFFVQDLLLVLPGSWLSYGITETVCACLCL